MKYAYYPGCSLHSTGREFDKSLRSVCDILGIELVEIEKWVCCGAAGAHNVSKLKTAQHSVKTDKNLKRDVVKALHKDCNEEAKVIHPLTIFAEEPLISKIPTLVKRDLSGLKVVSYYGCLLTRPPKITQFDIAEYPMSMDKVLKAVGIASLDWSYKTICCGASFALTKPEIVVKLKGMGSGLAIKQLLRGEEV